LFYLQNQYLPAFNAEFSHPALETGSAFVPLSGIDLESYLCEHYERVVGIALGACPRIENLLRKSPFGPFSHSFSLNMSDYSPQMIEKMVSKWLPLVTIPILGQPPSGLF